MTKMPEKYRPGFFCILTWLITWAGLAAGIVCIFISTETAGRVMFWSWGTAAVSAIISYIIRTVEKSTHDGKWSWHWFD